MRISDWSSDVCSSDLRELPAQEAAEHVAGFLRESRHGAEVVARHQRRGAFDEHVPAAQEEEREHRDQHDVDRKSVVSGKSVSVRVDLGVSRFIKRKIVYQT